MTQAKQTYDTIIAMRNTSSKTEKIALLSKIKSNDFAKEYLRMMYEPRINFYMKKVDPKAGNLRNVIKSEFAPSTLKWMRDNICSRKITGDAARGQVAVMYASFATEWERELLSLLIARDAKSGFGASTINKVWSDLITDIPYMRCCLPKDAKLDKFPWKEGVFSQLKCDGMFANATHTLNGDVTIQSRSGSPFPLDQFANIVAAVKKHVPVGNQLHGELLVYEGDKVLPRQLSNGQLNSVLQGGELEKGCTVVLVAWDMIPEDEAKAKNKYKVAYKDRLYNLGSVLAHAPHNAVQIVTCKVVYSMNEAQLHYKEMLEAGFEGTIIKNPEMIWEDTTSKQQVKMKLEAECDLLITGFNPGKGKNEALFGSIQAASACGMLEVGVSGMPDDMRKQLWEDKDNVVGRIMTVKSNCLMAPSKEGGKWSLFLPRLEEIRLDKKKADTLQRIKDQFDAAIQSVA